MRLRGRVLMTVAAGVPSRFVAPMLVASEDGDHTRATSNRTAAAMAQTDATAYVLLADGARFDGIACGADEPAVGEVVFTTSMAGYQEAVSDPSYAGQLLARSPTPTIGNYGVR